MVEKIRAVRNNNTKQKLIPNPTPILKTYQDSRKETSLSTISIRILCSI
jgi:hypothetical protein